MSRKGFTLIELIMVIVILGIISAIAIPKYVDLSTQAKNAAAKGAIGSIRAAIAIKYAESAVNGTPAFPAITGAIFADGKVPTNPLSPSSNAVVTTSRDNTGGWYYQQSIGSVESNDAAATSL